MVPISKQKLLQSAIHIPATTQIMGRLSKLLLSGDYSLDEVETLLESDTSLSAAILRVSNSAAFHSGTPSGSLREALQALGSMEVFRVASSLTARQQAATEFTIYQMPTERFWENALATAVALQRLSRETAQDPYSGYTIGLLRSFGRLVLQAYCTDLAREQGVVLAPYPGGPEDPPLLSWEETHLGTHHTLAGAYVMEQWQYPPDILIPIKFQYLPAKAPTHRKGTLLLVAANWVVRELGLGLPGEETYWADPPHELGEVGLHADDLTGLLEEIAKEYQQLESTLKAA